MQKKAYRRFLARLRKPFRYPERRRQRKLREAVAAVQANPKRCLDCGAQMQGPYCHACGQKEGTLKRPIWTFISDAFDYTLSSDSRFYRTLVAVVLRPGYLTREYMAGHRTRFFPPVRLYIVVSIAFFLLLAITNVSLLDLKLVPKDAPAAEETGQPETGDATDGDAAPAADAPATETTELPADTEAPAAETPNSPEVEKVVQDVITSLKEGGVELEPEAKAELERQLKEKEAAKQAAEDGKGDVIVAGQDDNTINLPAGIPYKVAFGMFVKVTDEPRARLTPAEIDIFMKSEDYMDDFLSSAKHGVARALGDPTASNNLLNIWLPRALLVLMPIFALLLSLTHWGKGRNYVHQLVFSLHFHTFLFLLMAALTVVVPLYGGGTGFSIFWWGTSLYIIIALKVGEMQSWKRAILKAGFIWVTYFTLLTVGISLAVFQGLRAL